MFKLFIINFLLYLSLYLLIITLYYFILIDISNDKLEYYIKKYLGTSKYVLKYIELLKKYVAFLCLRFRFRFRFRYGSFNLLKMHYKLTVIYIVLI